MSWAQVGRSRGVALCLLALLALCGQTARAAQYFLTIGGGYSPSGNQVSLERNVLYFQRLLAEQGLAAAPHEVFFADGDDPARDLQFVDPGFHVPAANLLLAQLAGEEEGLELQYRNHDLPGAQHGATRANIERWFGDVGQQLTATDRLVVYLTGHGGKGSSGENSLFHLWNGERMTVKEFTAQLDRVPPEVPVVLVMVQCYSGGFANVIFQGGDPAQGVSPARRCGFFATVYDRVAAGCTPDIREEDYQEYSTAFWAALGGRTRAGEPIDLPDFDGDGHVSFTEAHAYALIQSPTIDISVKTSDALLRAFSKLKSDEHADLLTAEAPCDELLATAAPAERTAIERLSSQLDLTAANRHEAAERLASEITAERRRVDGQKRKVSGEYQQLRTQLRRFVEHRWPELENPYHPVVCGLLQDHGAELTAAIDDQPEASKFRELHDEIARLGEQSLDLQRRWARCQRLMRVLENVALAANLPKVATPEQQQRYQALLACESSWLLDPAVNGPAAPLEAAMVRFRAAADAAMAGTASDPPQGACTP
ncbi:MAG: hypothetical protein K1X74_05415 [Pirellulales bacterium]|nr:hypothetical protein [Pirellulales bacterium]